MTLQDKLIRLRKKNGWSQEEFAERLNVSRQAVSKWESGQSMPELDKILQISALYGVTTDYLLKDEIGEESSEEVSPKTAPDGRRVSRAEAEDYFAVMKRASPRIAVGTFLCILAAAPLLSLIGASNDYGILPTKGAVGVGLLCLFLLIAVAVGLFIYAGALMSPFAFLERGSFSLEHGVRELVKEQQKTYQKTYMIHNIVGACLCVLSPIPILLGAFTESGFIVLLTVSCTLLIVGIGVAFFVTAGTVWGGITRLLGEESERGNNNGPSKTRGEKILDAISSVYWLTMTAIYLGWSFWSGDWGKTWIIWPIAGVAFAAVMAVANLFLLKEDK